jgi:hypothetical protein
MWDKLNLMKTSASFSVLSNKSYENTGTFIQDSGLLSSEPN